MLQRIRQSLVALLPIVAALVGDLAGVAGDAGQVRPPATPPALALTSCAR